MQENPSASSVESLATSCFSQNRASHRPRGCNPLYPAACYDLVIKVAPLWLRMATKASCEAWRQTRVLLDPLILTCIQDNCFFPCSCPVEWWDHQRHSLLVVLTSSIPFWLFFRIVLYLWFLPIFKWCLFSPLEPLRHFPSSLNLLLDDSITYDTSKSVSKLVSLYTDFSCHMAYCVG